MHLPCTVATALLHGMQLNDVALMPMQRHACRGWSCLSSSGAVASLPAHEATVPRRSLPALLAACAAATYTLPWMPSHATSLATLSYAPGQPWEFCPRSGGCLHAPWMECGCGCDCEWPLIGHALHASGQMVARGSDKLCTCTRYLNRTAFLPLFHLSPEAGAGAGAGAAQPDDPARLW